jgi:oligopeptidase B
VIDLASGGSYAQVVADVAPSFVWGSDSRTLYYAAVDENQRPKWVRRHRLGAIAGSDELLYEEKDDGFFLSLELTSSRRFVVLTAYDHTSSEAHVLAADDRHARFRRIEARRPEVIYDVSHNGDDFYLTVHAGREKDGKIVTAPVATPGHAGWRDLVPYAEGRLLQDVLMLERHLVRLEMVDALPQIVVRDLATGAEHTVAFAEAAFALALIAGHEFATTTLRFTYSSMTTPRRDFDYDLVTRRRTLRKEQEIPSGHDPSQYVVERWQAPARDGALVPITLLRHKTKATTGGPLYLYGYGSYGSSIPAAFAAQRFSLADRGFTVAIAHVRGGRERGFAWYDAAKILHKRRTFEDFIDCGRELVRRGVTATGRIVAHGASAGGMLMGAVANMAPELFLAIVADVPFVDVLNTMWDKELPLTPLEWPEWGNPIVSREAHDYIRTYSPYDNVAVRPYPHLLVLGGLTDPRVTYWEPAKWVARLREVFPSEKRLVLQTDMGAGHGGASGRFDALRKTALIYAFILAAAGQDGENSGAPRRGPLDGKS